MRLTHNFLIDRTSPPKCGTCNVQLTIECILENCSLNTTYFQKHDIERNIHDLLGNDRTNIGEIIEFIKETNLKRIKKEN